MILVSACLLGCNCKYSGGHNYNEEVVGYLKSRDYISVCPEELGGLSTPRLPCEIVNGRVMNANGEDLSKEFQEGAAKTLAIAKENQVSLAILQARSPSCGVGRIYDGSFSKRLIDGDGLAARQLKEAGIDVVASDQFTKDMRKISYLD